MRLIPAIEVKPIRIIASGSRSMGGGTTNTLSTVAKDNLVIEYEEDNGDEVQIRQRTEQSD